MPIDFESLIRYKALHRLYRQTINMPAEDAAHLERVDWKSTQFDVGPQCASQIECICAILGLSEVEFTTAALALVVAKAHKIMSEVGCSWD
jgi:hypothetical protein